ncbi:MAG: tRNA (adenosine(37)-N6)-threonylcarbamoyltransferase complex ATPase subunit type 1 TsaE [Flammeovirgaceae bacterium]|nr:tRNA (adenosine(37)-N6)-threonylcarbamoyltransferase complex ATPase subunit type 1 TsaE [Flammeovirgaceae bacterium]
MYGRDSSSSFKNERFLIVEVICNSVQETKNFANSLSKKFQKGQVIALNGDLGSGKTTFSQGIAKGLGIEQHVGSPTFKLVSEYVGKFLKLYHVDCYRLNNAEEFLNLGGENLLLPDNGITLIEWANIIQELLPENVIEIVFSRVKTEPNKRLIVIRGMDKSNE